MGEVFNGNLWGNLKDNIWTTLKHETTNLTKTQIAQLTLDIAGIFDPTPISDTAGALLSASQGDWWGAGLSVLGVIPYLGDVGKLAKIAKLAPKTADMLRMFMKSGDDLSRAGKELLQKYFTKEQVIAARREAAKRTRELMNRKRRDPNCKECKKVRQSNMPRKGKGGNWKTPDGEPPKSGTGEFVFDSPKKIPDPNNPGQMIEVNSIQYKDGFPDFDQYVHPSGKFDLWHVDGQVGADTRALKNEFGVGTPDGYTLHHFENGQVGYVPTELNNTLSHAGGNSIVNNDVY